MSCAHKHMMTTTENTKNTEKKQQSCPAVFSVFSVVQFTAPRRRLVRGTTQGPTGSKISAPCPIRSLRFYLPRPDKVRLGEAFANARRSLISLSLVLYPAARMLTNRIVMGPVHDTTAVVVFVLTADFYRLADSDILNAWC